MRNKSFGSRARVPACAPAAVNMANKTMLNKERIKCSLEPGRVCAPNAWMDQGRRSLRGSNAAPERTTVNSITPPYLFCLQVETKSGMYDILKVHVHRVQRQFRRTRFHAEILQRAMSLRTRRMRIEHIKKALKKHGLLRQVALRGVARRDVSGRYRPCKFATRSCRNRASRKPLR